MKKNSLLFQALVMNVRRSPLSQEHSRVSKSTDFIISVKRSRHINAKNFNPWIRLIKPVNLNNQAIGIGYRLRLVNSAAKKADRIYFIIFPHVLLWSRVSRNTNAHRQCWRSNGNSKAKLSWPANRNSNLSKLAHKGKIKIGLWNIIALWPW